MSATQARLEHDPVFYRDMGILLCRTRRLEFWPSPAMTLEEKVNATVRFVVYAGVLLHIATFDPKYVMLALGATAVLGFVHYHREGELPEATAPSSGRPTRPRSRDNPFANILHADPHADLPPPAWDQAGAATANKLFRSKMYMDLTNASGLQLAERQFMQMPEQDVDAFLSFLAQK